MSLNQKVAIIGSGLIGRQWAMIFTSFNYQVQLYDVNSETLSQTLNLIELELADLCEKKIARGDLSLNERMALLSTTESLEECLKDAIHVQECVFESLPLKQEVFEKVDKLLDPNETEVTICSSTSVHLPSLLFNRVTAHKGQCLVAHPINPPLHVRLVELVPGPNTRQEIVIKTRLLMDNIGQKPVVLEKEILGFALNRLQNAVFQEAFRLVHDGIMSPADVDTVVTDGLGPRYAFIGPWMTGHLNANGLGDYLERYGEGIYNVSKECQPLRRMEGEAAQLIVDEMLCEVPLEKLQEKRDWRNRCLIGLAQLKDKISEESS